MFQILRNIVIIFLVLCSIQVYGQYTIKGEIKCYSSSKNIGFASVIIDTSYHTYFKDRNYLGGTMTNQNGEFEVSNINEKNVNLILSYVGYSKLIVENINLNDSINDIGDIYMFPNLVDGRNKCKVCPFKNKKKNRKEMRIKYSKDGDKIHVKFMKNYVLINYQELSR